MKTIFLTGASRGLGRAIAEAALDAGNQVALTARNTDTLADLIASNPNNAAAFALDVTDPPQPKRRSTRRRSASVHRTSSSPTPATPTSSASRTPTAAIHAVVDTNLWGVVNVVKPALPILRTAGRGHLIHISSVSGRLAPAPGLGPYVTAKFAAEGFLEAVAKEVAGFGIQVTIVEPGRMATSLADSMKITELTGPYAELLRPLAASYANGAAAGTPPESAARFVLDVAALDEPRYECRSAALLDSILAAENLRLRELQDWEQLSRFADHAQAAERS